VFNITTSVLQRKLQVMTAVKSITAPRFKFNSFNKNFRTGGLCNFSYVLKLNFTVEMYFFFRLNMSFPWHVLLNV